MVLRTLFSVPLLLGVSVFTGHAEAQKAAPEPLKVMTWNLCGEAGGNFPDPSYCPFRDEPERKVEAIVKLAADQRLNALLFQEICSGPLVEDQDVDGKVSMLDLLKQQLGEGWSVAWGEMQRPGGRSDCRGVLKGTLGVAIAVRGTIRSTYRRPLPIPHGPRSSDKYSQTQILCVRVDGWKPEVCTTHLVNDDLSERDYAAEINAVIDFVANEPSIVLGGDFNTRRWDTWMKPMLDRYPECDAVTYGPQDVAREDTIRDGKIDYLFASAGFTACDVLVDGWRNSSTTSVPNGYSDHAPLVGTLRTLP